MMKRLLTAALVTVGGSAQALMPPCAYDAMIREAVSAVQITDLVVGAPDAGGYCKVDAVVAVVLHGDMAVGDPVSFPTPCEWDGSIGGTIWTDAAVLSTSLAAELHLDADGQIAGYGFGLILLPTITGQMVWRPVTDEVC